MDEDYDYTVDSSSLSQPTTFQEYQLRGEAPPPPPPPRPPTSDEEVRNESEDALLDLAQLEELHQEAERMKALGNKHMASQVSCTFPYLPILNIIFIRLSVEQYFMTGIYPRL